MKDDDKVQLDDLVTVRAAVTTLRRKVLIRSATISVLAGLVVGLIFYYLKSRNFTLSASIGGIFFFLGFYYFVGWWRHYRAIFKQLDLLEQRVRSGETVYGSQVAFHSYR